jgi:photosystem II stability/assembly factor-like uncharacterized protein
MKKLFIALICIFVIGSVNLHAQGFNSVTSPDGVYVIAVGDNGLLFRSSNGGNSFAQLTSGSDDFKSVCSVGDNVWFCGESGKVFNSTKQVFSVTQNTTGTANTLNGIDFIDANIGFTCGNGGVMYKTINGGTNWTSSSTGLPAVDLSSVSFKDANNGVVVGKNGTIYVTVNGGSSWTSAPSASTKDLLDVEYYSDGYVISGVDGTLIIKPTSGSYDIIETHTITDFRGLTGTSISDTRVVGGGGFIRNNNGSPDFLKFEANPMMADLVDITMVGPNGFAVSSLNKAIIRTANGGSTWQFTSGVNVSYSWSTRPGASGNFLGTTVSPHPFDKNTFFVVFGTTVYVSRNKGENWSSIATISSGNTPHSFYVSNADTNVWLCAITGSPDKVMRTTNYGATWTAVISQNFSNYGEPLEMDRNTPGTFYFAPDGGGYYKSSNNGATFSLISSQNFRSPCDLLVDHQNPNIQFIADGVTGSGLAEIFRSSNGGVNWTKVWTNPSSSEIPAITMDAFNTNNMRATNWPGQDIFKSTNNGVNWSLDYSTSHSGWGANYGLDDPNVFMSGSWSGSGSNTTFTWDNGATRLGVSGLSGAGGFMHIFNKGLVIAQSGSSVYKFNAVYNVSTEIHEITLNSGIPADYDLKQNYPNPFNPTTNIRYDVPKQGNVKLLVFDQLGRQVAELVNGIKSAGSYQIEFNGSNLSSGIYFYKLDVEGQSFTKKMILVK